MIFKKIVSGFLMASLIVGFFGEIKPVHAEEKPKEKVIVKFLDMNYDWKWGMKQPNGAYDYKGREGDNGTFSKRNTVLNMKYWLKELHPNMDAKLVKVEQYNGSNFDVKKAVNLADNNYWWLNNVFNDREKNQVESAFTKLFNNYRYNPVYYSDGKYDNTTANASFKYSGKYNNDAVSSWVDIKNQVIMSYKKSNKPIDTILGNDLIKEFAKRTGGLENLKKYAPGEYQKIVNKMANKSFQADSFKFLLKTNPTVLTFEVTEKLPDLAVWEVSHGDYPVCKEEVLTAKVANTSNKTYNTFVQFYFKGQPYGKPKAVRLQPKSYAIVAIKVNLPCKEGLYSFGAEINPSKKIKETTYKNNVKWANIKTRDIRQKINPNCPNTTTWTEVEAVTRCGFNSCWTVYYYFDYQATLKVKNRVYDDRSSLKKPNWLLSQDGYARNWIRAGYGMNVSSHSYVEVKQLSGAWQRSPKAKITRPTKAFFTTGWNMNNRRHLNSKQPRQIRLYSQNPSGLTNNFFTPSNTANKAKRPLIYTNVNLANGTHYSSLFVRGAFVNGQELCREVKVPIIIKGDMYDDKRTR